jgi:hypothetical protein
MRWQSAIASVHVFTTEHPISQRALNSEKLSHVTFVGFPIPFTDLVTLKFIAATTVVVLDVFLGYYFASL